MSTLSDILATLFPPRCIVCQEVLNISGSHICTSCLSQISYTRFWEYSDNSMSRHACDMQPRIDSAAAMLFYDGYSRGMIHRLKYRGQWRVARSMGEIFGAYLHSSDIYSTVDIIIPVPLHPFRLLQRGYNQSEYIAQGMAHHMGIKVDSSILYRSRYTLAQARKSSVERWEGGHGLFAVKHAEAIRGKHILLVDDVYTSGATIFRCVEAIHRAQIDCKISVVALATPRR